VDRVDIDPRVEAARRMTSGVRRVLCMASGKGGVGKSVLSSVSALLLSSFGRRVGLLDLDFYGPSVHTILGTSVGFREERGILPAEVHGVKLMSILPFARESPVLWRGQDVSQAILELLAVTRWGELDFLIVDMPPGTGEEILEIRRFLPRAEFIAVVTPSKLAVGTVARLVRALSELGANFLGFVENMSVDLRSQPDLAGARFLGRVRFDPGLEAAIGKPDALLRSLVAEDLRRIWSRLLI
jgi:ATP-binding protein involved in chromosome partitioning